MDVVVLAGGRCSPDLAKASGVSERAMLPVGGEPMVELVLRAVASFGRIILVGGPGREPYTSVPSGDTFLASLAAGLAQVSSDRLLLCTGDLPFLTEEAVADFLARCDHGAMLNYSIVPIEAAEARFPGMRRTTLSLREGTFTGGNVALAESEGLRRAMPVLASAYAVRKSPLRLAGIVGWSTLLRVALGKLVPWAVPVASLESSVGRFLGARVQAVVTPFAEIGADVDDAEQYATVVALTKQVEPTN